MVMDETTCLLNEGDDLGKMGKRDKFVRWERIDPRMVMPG